MEYCFTYVRAVHGVWRRHDFQAESDTAALEIAWEIFKLTGMPEHGFELWQGSRRVHNHNC